MKHIRVDTSSGSRRRTMTQTTKHLLRRRRVSQVAQGSSSHVFLRSALMCDVYVLHFSTARSESIPNVDASAARSTASYRTSTTCSIIVARTCCLSLPHLSLSLTLCYRCTVRVYIYVSFRFSCPSPTRNVSFHFTVSLSLLTCSHTCID